MKKITNMVSIAIIIGFFIGLISFINSIITKHSGVLNILTEALNKWTVLSIIILCTLFIIVVLLLFIVKMIWKLFFSNIITINIWGRNRLGIKARQKILPKGIKRVAFALFIFILILNLLRITIQTIRVPKRVIPNYGQWHFVRRDKHAEKLLELIALPYLQGSHVVPEQKGVTVYNESLAYNGVNLCISGHAPEAFLMDMYGNILHKWRYDFKQVWPDYRVTIENTGHDTFWRRVHLYENGDLLAIFEGIGLIKIDKDSKLLWYHKGGEHHDMDVTNEGFIYVLTRKRKRITISEKFIEIPALEDFITILDPQGKKIKKISLLEYFEKSRYENKKEINAVANKVRHLLNLVWYKISNSTKDLIRGKQANIKLIDIFHTNTLEVLDGKFVHQSNIFKRGNVLISLRNTNTIGIIDLDSEEVVWALRNGWNSQHQPTLLQNGNILLFDNNSKGYRSGVIEFNPLTQEIIWEYKGTQSNPFFSKTCGSNQRLSNGNTLITESNAGRAFEVTLDKKIVWEFINPYRAGKKNELIATLFEVIRLEPTFSLDWMTQARTDWRKVDRKNNSFRSY